MAPNIDSLCPGRGQARLARAGEGSIHAVAYLHSFRTGSCASHLRNQRLFILNAARRLPCSVFLRSPDGRLLRQAEGSDAVLAFIVNEAAVTQHQTWTLPSPLNNRH